MDKSATCQECGYVKLPMRFLPDPCPAYRSGLHRWSSDEQRAPGDRREGYPTLPLKVDYEEFVRVTNLGRAFLKAYIDASVSDDEGLLSAVDQREWSEMWQRVDEAAQEFGVALGDDLSNLTQAESDEPREKFPPIKYPAYRCQGCGAARSSSCVCGTSEPKGSE